MDAELYDTLTTSPILLFCLLMGAGAFILYLFFTGGWWTFNRKGSPSPFTGFPLRRGLDLTYQAVQHLEAFCRGQEDEDNPPIDLRKAAVCQETGRILPNCVNIFNVARLPKDYLAKRSPGRWVPWWELSNAQQAVVQCCYPSFEGFQREPPESFQSDRLYSNQKPGPLYVDLATNRILGWQCVPGTSLEVMVVKKPHQS